LSTACGVRFEIVVTEMLLRHCSTKVYKWCVDLVNKLNPRIKTP